VLPPAESLSFLPPIPLPVPPPVLRPSPPSGGLGRAFEKQREEEVAPEESQAFARYHPDESGIPPGYVIAAIVLAAFAGASTIRGGPRGRGTRAAPVTATSTRTRRRT
jgi:hypothetical protein